MDLSRRQFFSTLSAAVLGVNSRARGADQARANFIIRSASPEDFEMPLEGFLASITPNEKFFVRTHVLTPKVDLAQWQLRIEGEVQSAFSLTMDDLKKLPRAELVAVLECAGNGRAFYRPTVPGLQWTHGGVGNARWTGVRLADILKKAGVKSSAKEILFNGADVPIGTMPDFIRTIPVAKALHPDTLLAFEMNGQPLPESHGFPLRLIVPGWAGDNWIKWITHIQLIDREYEGFWMKTGYRHPVHSVAPGTAVDPAQMTPVTSLGPKSVIASPVDGHNIAPGSASGSLSMKGAAWSGESPVARVEVSIDNGRSWRPARLDAARGPYSWRLWEASWTPPGPGSYVLLARATDRSGQTQPLSQEWNPSGYLWNVVQQVRVNVASPGPAPADTATPAPPFPESLRQSCIGCHGEDMIAGQKLTRAQWEREVDKMVRWGATVKPADRSAIVDFLAGHFGR